MDSIHVEMTADECAVLADIIVARLEHLTKQPQSVSRDSEATSLLSLSNKIYGKIAQIVKLSQN